MRKVLRYLLIMPINHRFADILLSRMQLVHRLVSVFIFNSSFKIRRTEVQSNGIERLGWVFWLNLTFSTALSFLTEKRKTLGDSSFSALEGDNSDLIAPGATCVNSDTHCARILSMDTCVRAL